MLPYGHIHQPKVDQSNIIYPGSLTSCGFDEPGDHGMVVGEINALENQKFENKGPDRLKSGIVNYQFVKMDEIGFEKKSIDISNILSNQELVDKLQLNENIIYKIELYGERNLDTAKFKEYANTSCENIYEINDNTHIKYNLEEISKEDTLKGIFTKKVLEDIKENEDNEKYYNAIEFVYRIMKG